MVPILLFLGTINLLFASMGVASWPFNLIAGLVCFLSVIDLEDE